MTAVLCLPFCPPSTAFCIEGPVGLVLLDAMGGLAGKAIAAGREVSMAAGATGAVGVLDGSMAAGAVGGLIGITTAVDADRVAGRVLAAEESVDRGGAAALGWLGLVASPLFSCVALDAGTVEPLLLQLLMLRLP